LIVALPSKIVCWPGSPINIASVTSRLISARPSVAASVSNIPTVPVVGPVGGGTTGSGGDTSESLPPPPPQAARTVEIATSVSVFLTREILNKSLMTRSP
jgi:hypothetical protein